MSRYDITIVHLNDIHGRVEDGNTNIGFSRLKNFIEDLRSNKNNGRVFLVDSGDTIHGTTFANLSKGESMVEVYNHLGFDFVTLGNHDFNYGYKRLKELNLKKNYSTLVNNLKDLATGEFIGKPYEIVEVEGLKICFFGIITPETYYKTNSKNIKGVEIEDPILATEKMLNEINKKEKNIDYKIAITHLGDEISTEEKNRSSYLAKKFPEIDLILDGHSHAIYEKPEKIEKTSIVQTGCYSNNVGLLQIKILEKNIDYRLIPKEEIHENYQQDMEVENIIDEIIDNQRELMNKIIGETSVYLEGNRDLVRSRETNFTQLVTDSILWKTGADAVLINGGGIRDSLPPGQITLGEILRAIPFGNYIITKEVKGSDIKEALENGLKAYPNSLGAMAQIAGMEVIFNPKEENFKRVKEVKIGSENLCLNKRYKLAVTDFMSLGGENYNSLINSKEVGHYQGIDDILIEYIEKIGVGDRKEIQPRLIAI
ncbi:MAG: bifunctional metallophosphatase/5'-nucleotidase [Cetobacterium sp.]